MTLLDILILDAIACRLFFRSNYSLIYQRKCWILSRYLRMVTFGWILSHIYHTNMFLKLKFIIPVSLSKY